MLRHLEDYPSAWAHLKEEAAEDTQFARALAWQNPALLEFARERLERYSVENKKGRALVRRLAAYLCRYATKNETVGEVGPVCWARLTAGDALPRRPEVDDRRAWLEPRFATRLVDEVAASSLQKDAPLHLHADLRWEPDEAGGGRLKFIPGSRVWESGRPLDDVTGAVVEAALAGVSESQLLRIAHETDDAHLASAVEAAVASLVDEGLLFRRVAVPIQGDALAALPEALSQDLSRAQVDLAQGSADAVMAAQLQAAPTPAEPGAGAGSAYAGRLPFFMTASTPAVEVGRDRFEPIALPLAAIGLMARWYTTAIAERFLQLAAPVVDETGSAPLPLVMHTLGSAFADGRSMVAEEVGAELGRRFSALLNEHGEGEEGLLEEVERRFAAPAPGWPSARHSSPDLMLAADQTWVLGEVHVGHNSLMSFQGVQHAGVLGNERTGDDVLRQLLAADIEAPIVSELGRQHFAICAHDCALDPERDFHLDTGSRYTGMLGPSRTLRAGDLTVLRQGAHLMVDHSSGTVPTLPLQSVLERLMKLTSMDGFALRAPQEGTRARLGALTVSRRGWTFDAEELAAVSGARGPRRKRMLRELFARRHLPERCFVGLDSETKPMFVDLGSDVLVESLAGALGGATRARVTEALPDPRDAWLTDAQGRRYAAELRVVLVDPRPFEPLEIDLAKRP